MKTAVVKDIPYSAWYRHTHAEFFSKADIPFVTMHCDIDVMPLKRRAKALGISFYLSLVWLSHKVIESREDFRWRLRGDRAVLLENLMPSFTDMMAGTELFKIVNVEMEPEMEAFARRARAAAEKQDFFFPSEAEEANDHYVYCSCAPVVRFTGLFQTLSLDKDDFIPALAWGKYEEIDGKLLLPYAFKFNHRLADGFHVGRFFVELQEAIHALD